MSFGELILTAFLVVGTLLACGFIITTAELYVRTAAETFGCSEEEVWEGLAVAAFFAVLMALVLSMPKPDYWPERGSDPCDIPYQMRD